MNNSFSIEYISDIILYFLIFCLSALFIRWGFKRKTQKKLHLPHIIIGILIPAILAGIRYGVGNDYFSYLGMYNEAAAGHQIYFREIEPLSTAIITASAKLDSSVIMFLSFSLISNICYLASFKKFFAGDYKKIAFSYLLYLLIIYPTTLNAIRSGTALSICTLAFSYLYTESASKKTMIRTLVALLIASLFHTSSLISVAFLPVVIVSRKEFRKNNNFKKALIWFVYTLVAIMTPFFYSNIGKVDLGNYSRYLVGFGENYSIPLANIIMIIPVILAYSIKKYSADETKQEAFKKLRYCSLFFIPLSIFTGWFTYAEGLSRISFLLDPFIICIMTYLCLKNEKASKYWRIAVVSIVGIVASLMFIRNLNWSGDLPYRTIYQEESIYETKN